MILYERKGNMYEFVTHTWNPIKGKCYHDCSYCYMKKINPDAQPVRLVENELQGDFGINKFIFVDSSTDMFAQNVKDEWIKEVLDFCLVKTSRQAQQERTRFMFQTKNLQRLLQFISHPLFDVERKQAVICTTLETNRHYPDIMNNAPLPQDRAEAMNAIAKLGIETFVTVEPIMDFDLGEFVSLVKRCNPLQVNIGINTNANIKLPCPAIEKLINLILLLTIFTKVHIKKNANNENNLCKSLIHKLKKNIFFEQPVP